MVSFQVPSASGVSLKIRPLKPVPPPLAAVVHKFPAPSRTADPAMFSPSPPENAWRTRSSHFPSDFVSLKTVQHPPRQAVRFPPVNVVPYRLPSSSIVKVESGCEPSAPEKL